MLSCNKLPLCFLSPLSVFRSLNEANLMDLASFKFVLRVYGLFEGCPPELKFPKQGIVMEFMPRGSVDKLQQDLCGPPPWPLAFRLAHEVALGMNFLHSKKLVHCDLKPSNVLLNEDLHAKVRCHASNISALHTMQGWWICSLRCVSHAWK